MGKIGLFDKCVRPDRLQQFLFVYQVPVLFHQRLQKIEGLGSERYRLACAPQETFAGIQAERAEFVEVLNLPAHSESQKFLRTLTDFSQTNRQVSKGFCGDQPAIVGTEIKPRVSGLPILGRGSCDSNRLVLLGSVLGRRCCSS